MRRALLGSLLATLPLLSGGCYYGHLASGQLRLLWMRQPIEEAVAAPETNERTRGLLRLVGVVRRFGRELGLDVGDQYTSFVDWPDDRIVTTLVRTRAGSLEAVPWRYPFLGELPYRGYFDRKRAEAEAERLRSREDYDVCETGVKAYSTLGWLADPVTSPMLERGAASLVETLLHELVHATAFVPDEADFNEGVALFIGQQAAIRFFDGPPPEVGIPLPEAERVAAAVADRRLVAEATLAFKDRLAELNGAPDRAARRPEAEARARAELAALPLEVLDAERVARAARLSDACLALRGTYVRDTPRHAAVLAALDGDLRAMVERLARWAEEEQPVETFFEIGDEGPARTGSKNVSGP